MTTIKRYKVRDKYGRETVWNLSDEQAERLGAEPVGQSPEPEPPEEPAKTRKATTKTRRARDK